MVELRWAIPESTTGERPRLQYRQLPAVVQFGSAPGWTEWQDVPYVVVQQEQPRKITSLEEFCAEATRTGLTVETLAKALSKRPEFADCLPGADGEPVFQQSELDVARARGEQVAAELAKAVERGNADGVKEPHPCRWFNGRCIDCGRAYGEPRTDGVPRLDEPQQEKRDA